MQGALCFPRWYAAARELPFTGKVFGGHREGEGWAGCAHTCTLHYRGSYARTGISQNWGINWDPGWGRRMTEQGQEEEEIGYLSIGRRMSINSRENKEPTNPHVAAL